MFKDKKCDWYRCNEEPVVLRKGHPYGIVVLCSAHNQCVDLAVGMGREFRHKILENVT